MDIHEYELRYQAALRGIEKVDISPRNKELILACKDALVLEGLSRPRIIKYMEILRSFAKKNEKRFRQSFRGRY